MIGIFNLHLFNQIDKKLNNMQAAEFDKMVTKEASSLRQYAYQLTRNVEDAHDLVQETMLKAFTYKARFQEGTNLKGWLYTIMKNSFINNYRRLVKRNTFIDSTDNTYYLDSMAHATANSSDHKFVMRDIEAAIEQLPKDLRKTFTMNYSGFKYHEISEILNIPIGTVKTRIFVARRILRGQLKNYGDAFGLMES